MYLQCFFFIALLVALHSIVSTAKPPQYFRFRRYGAMGEFDSIPKMKGFIARQSPVMYMGIGKK